ncbi:hypothetical protein ACFLYP_02420 [Chloroflexota bacterium]
MKKKTFILNLLIAMFLASCAQTLRENVGASPASEISLWSVKDGNTVEEAASGFFMPVAIEFLPEPGPDPDDYRYFVVELLGVVKAVTNAGEVVTVLDDFGDFSPSTTSAENNSLSVGGLGGMCFAPEQGYILCTNSIRSFFIASLVTSKIVYRTHNAIARFNISSNIITAPYVIN